MIFLVTKKGRTLSLTPNLTKRFESEKYLVLISKYRSM